MNDKTNLQVLIILKEYQIELKTAIASDRNKFYALLNKGIELLKITDEDIALRFSMSLPGVSRWKNGRTAPHTFMCPVVFKWLGQKTIEYILKLENE